MWIEPSHAIEARSGGRIVAKDTACVVKAIVDLGDEIAVAHHEGLIRSPGGITVRRRSDFAITRSAQGAFGQIVPIGNVWLAEGSLWAGKSASAVVLEPSTLSCTRRLPVAPPFVALDEHRFVATTPPDVDPAIVRSSNMALPAPGGLVEVDLRRDTARLLLAGRPLAPFHLAVAAPARDIVYAATGSGWIVALRIADGAVLWERPPARTVMEWSGYALALDPTGALLACGGLRTPDAEPTVVGDPADLIVLDTRDGRVHRTTALCLMLDRARVAPKTNASINALAFHPTGWLAAATNAGVVAELRANGAVSAFRAATRGIHALAFVDRGASLVVGGSEKNLRVWPVDTSA